MLAIHGDDSRLKKPEMADSYATERVYIMIKNFSEANAELIWEGNLAPDMVEILRLKKSLRQQIKLDQIGRGGAGEMSIPIS